MILNTSDFYSKLKRAKQVEYQIKSTKIESDLKINKKSNEKKQEYQRRHGTRILKQINSSQLQPRNKRNCTSQMNVYHLDKSGSILIQSNMTQYHPILTIPFAKK